ncbi:SCO6880 family protein [Streptomyces platensis]|uniref:SCO6880 family protein n=1 Tax=Streptomyces platensis TaxID=58346 RepID=UPI0033209C2E
MSDPTLYGGWRRTHTLGIGTLNTSQTFILVGAVLVNLVGIVIAGLPALPLTLPISLTVIVLAVWQRHGMPLLSYATGMLRWRLAAARGETSYRGHFLPVPEALDLPGLAAPTKLIRAQAGSRTVGLVWNQRSGHMTGTLLLQPAGALLAAGSVVDTAVSSWGQTLAQMADEDPIAAASVTLQITPSSGHAVTQHVTERRDPNAPQLARATTDELVARAPRASAQLAAWFSLVIDPNRAGEPTKNPAEAAGAALGVLDGIDLGASGADVLRAATDSDIKRIVRGGYVPSDMDAPAQQIEDLLWHEVGPTYAEDGKDIYEHDGYYSISYVLRAAPRKDVAYDVLLRLLSAGRFSRRVTLAYRVLPTEEGRALIERELNASDAREEYRQRTRRSTTRRERVDAARANRTADEEAVGHAMTQWSVYVTTTVKSVEDIPAARREVEKAAKLAGGMRFRPAYGAQSAAMALGLPLGINPLL